MWLFHPGKWSCWPLLITGFWAHLVELLLTTWTKKSLYNDQLLQGSDGIRDYDPGAPRLNSIKLCLENIGKYNCFKATVAGFRGNVNGNEQQLVFQVVGQGWNHD